MKMAKAEGVETGPPPTPRKGGAGCEAGKGGARPVHLGASLHLSSLLCS